MLSYYLVYPNGEKILELSRLIRLFNSSPNHFKGEKQLLLYNYLSNTNGEKML